MSACTAEWNERLSAWLDGEATPTEAAAIQSHTRSCVDCAGTLDVFAGLRSRIRKAHPDSSAMSSDTAFDTASERIRASVLAAADRDAGATRRQRLHHVVRVASSVAAIAVLLFGALYLTRPTLDSKLMLELESQHMRAFAHGRPCEFESSDPQLVSDWIEEQSDRRVEVPMLPGAVLLGARRCKLHGRPAMALVYQVEGRGLTVFVPGEGTDAADAATSFADGGARCTTGRLGERICAASGSSRSALAVGNDDHLVLLASTAVIDG